MSAVAAEDGLGDVQPPRLEVLVGDLPAPAVGEQIAYRATGVDPGEGLGDDLYMTGWGQDWPSASTVIPP
ncbi:hypothetical protein, partial [Streptomyces sp. NPDC044948]|uniref:hypothetical protein n=1 Tax=Streptomyces sp. NPDC044948 TaxID=3157092 RepID=UPI0033E8E6E9